MKKIFKLFLFALAAAALCSCRDYGQKSASLKIVNWNAQTFFDGNNDGVEYPNFAKSKKWNQDAYKERLQKLCKAINQMDGDLVVLEEIENVGIVYDISNALAGNSWNPAKVYRYACFAKDEKSSIGCAVLSRRQLRGMKVHSLDIKSEKSKAPSMRPIIEVDLLAPKPLKLFINHWKSKSGGGDSALWRKWQESLLAQKIIEAQKNDSKAAILCAGDFNQDIKEFSIAAADQVELNARFSGEKPIARPILRKFFDTVDIFFISLCAAIVGYAVLMIMLNASVRDFTPESKAGQFQGIRMIFYVLIPMVVGPMLGNAASVSSAVRYTDEFGVSQVAPTSAMFLWAAAVAALVFLPLAFLMKAGFKVKKETEETE